jgi:hypothetical protein
MVLRKEVLRAAITKTLAHGERYVMRRAYFSDGTIEQQLNPGHPDEGDLPWKRIGSYLDLMKEREALARDGWAIEMLGQ